jgi:hypothetical protein
MGFFDRFSSKKPAPASTPPATPVSAAAPTPGAASEPSPAPAALPAGGVKARLAAAREKLEAKDLPGAMAVYEEVLAVAGDRADVLVAISGDLGSNGHIAEIVELIAPRYDADRHGPATGLNLLQAYLALRNADAAQHVLDILFGLNRPDLEDQLHGFSNAIAEIIAAPAAGPMTAAGSGASGDVAKIGLITISKPIWSYGLESMAERLLPPKEGRLRRLAFAQLALPGHGDKSAAAGSTKPEDELGRLSRAIPLWLAETFYFSPLYSPVAAIGVLTPPQGGNQYVTFGAEWTTDNLRQVVETSEGVDYIVTGALRGTAGDYEAILRVWEVKGFRERKTFTARWTPSTADAALTQLHTQVREYMEWSPASAAFAYVLPAQPRPWLDTLGVALGFFLVEKAVLPAEVLGAAATDLPAVAQRAASGEAASLAWLTLRARATRLGIPAAIEATLARSPLVIEAQKLG